MIQSWGMGRGGGGREVGLSELLLVDGQLLTNSRRRKLEEEEALEPGGRRTRNKNERKAHSEALANCLFLLA